MASAKTISDEVAADDNGISASANPGNNAALTRSHQPVMTQA